MTTTIDPRIRERRIEVQREAGRKRLRVLLVIVGVFVALGCAYLLVQSPMLDVDHVRVEGVQHLDAATVERVAAVQRGAPLLRVDTGAVERRLETVPWVADATVTRALPGTLRITVRERVPVMFAKRSPQRVALLDATGTVITDAPTPPAKTIEVQGARVPAVGAQLAVNAPGVLQAIPRELATQVGAIDVTDNRVTLRLWSGSEVRMCGAGEYAAKGAAAVAVMQRLGDTPFAYVDVCVPSAPVAR